ncbi:VOC family protein [Pigmentiphaga sp.]|uniref:VOC family protein n=1 Tax=Pigmentiphaga sp. TaxID=1977564 RepID=UPI00128E5E69|nr:VOC family protein [Pigmentiphaga sp.]MPS28253.1 glyoxalase [Alcaligenaceae bacterium SAGV5]MPS51287.1 glyoxalase [Alcaligenaceae bacterium SAGV3]MPT59649.1 glyoxalase [Alcaligenaceae bacterium]
MTSTLIEGLRSVSLDVPDLAHAEAFYTQTWNLTVAGRRGAALYLRGAGHDAYLLALHAGRRDAGMRHVTLRARSEAALDTIAAAAGKAGGAVVQPLGVLDDPAGGVGLTIRDAHGRRFQIVHGDARHEGDAPRDRPVRLAHVVLNSSTPDATRRFIEEVFDFRLIDLTAMIAFMNCNRDHHTIGVGLSDNDALNHIAFFMPDGDSLMRGGGRLKDAGYPVQWGPGRHGPGNNLFNYFIDPFGVVIEYTAEVQQVDDSYVPRGPEAWKWPAGRVDQWGLSDPPTDALKAAQRRIHFSFS